MFIQTHMLIAKHINKIIQQNFNITIDFNSFRYGSIKPDIDPRMISIPHYKNDSFDIIMDMIASLQKYNLPACDKELKTFSVKLGVINHYLTDFFCFPHNNEKACRLVPHLLYENKLAQEFYKIDLNKICNDTINSIAKCPSMNIKEYAELRHIEYMNGKPSINKDVFYSVEICTAASYLIVYNCLNNIYIEKLIEL
ncbi:zinc dependent phospholipase C family protein [Clostridium pasteurianum]|uniref:Phospholipase C/D domain-containing protein n=1 Tax=Clostridium pasteurianum BC1 TaxID=86416 RepID=R4K0T6_CLOPA|nr:zinc dependent phospholipase C family protein [Clostridium pasteurianum]AGK96702.1 hypothetical protein Clopa_1793 [Clostridium pasteurianum BC1]